MADYKKVTEDIRPSEKAARLLASHAPPMRSSRPRSRVSAGQLRRRALARLIATAGATMAATALVSGGLVLSSAEATPTVLYAAPTAQGAGDCATAPSACTLNTALAQVGPGQTIELISAGPYNGGFTLSTAGTTPSAPVTIEPAPSVDDPVLSGGSSQLVLNIASAAYVTVSGVTIEDGSAENGPAGINDSAGGTLTVNGSNFTGNVGNNGGAIGVGVGNAGTGTATVAGSSFSGNFANWGGAINVGDGQGASGTLDVSGSTFTDNSSYNYAGGALAIGDFGGSGTTTITGSTFTGNNAGDEGGAIDNGFYSSLNGHTGHATLVVSGTTFDDNSGNYGPGGAIENAGGDGGLATASVSTSTFIGNFGNIGGGAIDNAFGSGSVGTLTVTSSTFTGDTAHNGGSPAIENGGGNPAGSATTTVTADVFAEDCNDSSGTWTDGGYNVGSDSTCLNRGTGDNGSSEDLSSLLAPLANNGGPTQTVALDATNPAVGIVPNGTSGVCPVTDQRDITSPGGGACDAGAVQLAGQTVAITTSAPAAAAVGSSYAPAAVASSGLAAVISIDASASGCALASGVITFTAPGSCVIDANQAGNSWNAPAAQVQQAMTVSAPPGPTAPLPPAPPAGSTSWASASSLSPSGSATATNLGTTADGQGFGALTVAQYPSDPAGPPNFPTSGEYFDVRTSSSASFSSVTIRFCGLAEGRSLEWWGPGGWEPVQPTPQHSLGPPSCVTVTLSGLSSPSLTQLGGTVFAVSVPPGAPSALTATAGVGQVRLAWSPPPSGDSSMIARYDILRGLFPGAENAEPIASVPATTAVYTDRLVTPGAAYFYEVEAVGVAGSSGPSNEASATPVPATVPYNLVSANGGVFGFGDASFQGSVVGLHLGGRVVAMAATPDGKGYWLVSANGGVFSFGDASFQGSAAGLHLGGRVVGMAATPDGRGYWLASANGGVFSFGDAGFQGSAAGLRLGGPVVGMAATPDGKGYWLASANGGVFSFGDASFQGSAAGLHLGGRVVGMAATPDAKGYWLVSANGGVFSFGDASFQGSAAGLHLGGRIVGMAATPDGRGYWLVSANGGVFSFGDASFQGSAVGLYGGGRIVGIAADREV
ncbi:MAG TPA: choice-of-anchor Q domain-containing protein [Acidimicrobiales bacterium]|nr:choice-of-anchor Q domain-containing protein [Acidimicrobiales bacterium]